MSAFLSAALVITHVFMALKALALLTGSRTPLAVVTSESMEPGFQRGDILLLWNRPNHIMVGDIALVAFPTRKLPMVHRVVQSYYLPTKAEGEAKQTRILPFWHTPEEKQKDTNITHNFATKSLAQVSLFRSAIWATFEPQYGAYKVFRSAGHKIEKEPPYVKVPAFMIS
ncbi:hypothetical protein PWT90_03834 [Aphanocladium album]|nr:hypothetical protein PWT90_03834 [Aphanocladium album]